MDAGEQLPVEVSVATLRQQVDRLKSLVRPLLADPAAPIPPRLTASLFDFYITAQERQACLQAAETARSLASLLHGRGDRPLREAERLQVVVLLEALQQDLAPADSQVAEGYRPLVTPIAPTEPTVNTRIALFMDAAPLQVMLRESLASAGFTPMIFDSLDALAAVDEAGSPAAIVAEISRCRLDPQTAAVFANLRERFSPSPHLVCIAPGDDIPARLDAVRLGATRFLPLPLDTARLVAILKGVTVQVPPRPFRVVLVDDDPFLAEVCRDGLEESGIRTRVVADPLLAPAEVRAFQPDVVICDIFMPGCNGLELLSLLRQDDDLIDTPILLLSSDAELERRLEALNLGADEFLMKPIDMSLLVAAVTARARRARTLRRSRSELRRLQERVRELEMQESDEFRKTSGTIADFDTANETINMDDYVVSVVDENGKRRWSRGKHKK